MDPKCTEDIAECFPQLLPALVSSCISTDTISFNDGDSVHKLNTIVLGKLLSKNRDLLSYVFLSTRTKHFTPIIFKLILLCHRFVMQYFEVNPAPFESVEIDPNKRNKRKVVSTVEVPDYDLLTACYDILRSAPTHFKYIWNWSKFFKYLTHDDEIVKW